MLVPCNYVHAEFGDVGDYVSEGCVEDLQKQADYLTNLKVIVYFSERSFSESMYEDKTITASSRFFTSQIDSLKPSWINGQVQQNELEDEVSYFQYGQQSHYTYYTFGMPDPIPSSWNVFPTKLNPSSRYKFMSVEVNMSLDKKRYSR